MTSSRGNPQAASNFLADSLKMASARLEAFQSIGDIFGLNLDNIYNVSHTTPAANIADQIQKVRLLPAPWPVPTCMQLHGRIKDAWGPLPQWQVLMLLFSCVCFHQQQFYCARVCLRHKKLKGNVL